MPRPFMKRFVRGRFNTRYYKPPGIPLRELKETVLGVDEIEAVRLADYEGGYQSKCAEKMGVSRQTFGNIIKSARLKIAEALIEGKAIRIEGGPVLEENDIVQDQTHGNFSGGNRKHGGRGRHRNRGGRN